MKIFAFVALISAASAIRIQTEKDEYDLKGGWERHVNGDPEDYWIEVPKFDIAVKDSHWGHEVQRVGHYDWLDKHAKEVKAIKESVPPPPDKENRVAIADS